MYALRQMFPIHTADGKFKKTFAKKYTNINKVLLIIKKYDL